jgi:L-ascorbate metabolism protein UlaG (beta-lactamase superfamily)
MNSDSVRKPLMKRRRWLHWLGASAVTGSGLVVGKDRWLSAGPGWRGPSSDHFDGTRFFNPWGEAKKGLLDYWRWKLGRDPEPWPASAGGMVSPRLPAALTPGEATVTFVGHATFLIQGAGLNVLTDPVWSDRCSPVTWAGPKRVRPPALAWNDLPPIHAVLLSHNHYDHLDLRTLTRLRDAFDPLILTGLGNKAFLARHGLQRVVELDWWQSHALPPGGEVTFTPARHWSNRGGYGLNETLWGGFMLHAHGRRIFFCGDSGYAPCFEEIRQRCGAPDLAMLPIGAYEPRWFMSAMHMNPAEALRVHHDLGARRSLAMHFGTWQLTDEGIGRPVEALTTARAAAGLSAADFHVPAFGETLEIRG